MDKYWLLFGDSMEEMISELNETRVNKVTETGMMKQNSSTPH
jgi:hypothetical protein